MSKKLSKKLWTTLSTACCCLTLLVLASPAAAAPTICNVECDWDSCATQGCTDPESSEIITCQEWGTWDYNDDDCDGIDDGPDNCPSVANANQANCDGDSWGDVCDSENADYQPTGSETFCFISSDFDLFPVPNWDLDLYADIVWEDQSSCGAPDDVRTSIVDPTTCFGIPYPSKYNCCVYTFGTSLCDDYLDDNQCTGN